jgi:hypothetical protein
LDSQGYEVFEIGSIRVDSVLSEWMQASLIDAFNWCEEANLAKPSKPGLENPVIRGITIEFSRKTQYLGVVLDH